MTDINDTPVLLRNLEQLAAARLDTRDPVDPHRTCETCRYFCVVASPDGSGQCRYAPPETHAVLVHPAELPAGLARAGMAPQPQVIPVALWPSVTPDAWCGQHEEV